MKTSYLWIEDSESLARELDTVLEGPVAIDLEADSFHHYREKTCLIQFAYRGRQLIIDPLAGIDPAPLGRILADPAIRKIFHGSDYDLRLLDRDFHLPVQGLFDTMIAARLTGETAFGLSALLEKHIGVTLDKKYQRADWSRRPLTPEMLDYAISDIVHLFELSDLLEGRLEELNRLEWAQEEFRFLEQVRWEAKSQDDTVFLKIKGARKLKPGQLSVLRRLFEFREVRAKKRDVPRFRIMRDPVLLDLARSCPTDLQELRAIKGIPGPFSSGGLGEALLHEIRKGVKAPPYQALESRGNDRRRMTKEEDVAIRKIMEQKAELAETLGLETSLLGSRNLINSMVVGLSEGKDWRRTDRLRRWQETLLAPMITSREDSPQG